MIRATSAALLLFLVTLTGCAIYLTRDAHKLLVHLDGAALRAQGIETKANATLINLDKGTAIWAAASKDQAGAIADLATDIHGTVSEANATLRSVQPVTAALTDEIGALHKTTDAATGLTVALTRDAETANVTIAAGKPLLEAYTRTGNDLDAILKDNATQFHETLFHIDAMSASGDKMLADAQWKEHQLLHPDKVKLGFWGGMWAAAKYVHQFEPPIF